MTSDVPLPPAWAGGRETTALVTPDNHLWSLCLASSSKYLQASVRHYLTVQAGWWGCGGWEGDSREVAFKKRETEARKDPHARLPRFPTWAGKVALSQSEAGWRADSRKNFQEAS